MQSSHQRPSLKQNLTDPNRIPYLDGWRGIAICLVLAQHFFIPIDSPLVFLGMFGVDFFFVLSGMLMSRILFEKRMNLKLFYKRRVSRIFPVFIIFVVVSYTFAYFAGKSEAKNFLYSLFFIRTYLPFDDHIWHTDLAIGHLWSLNVEEHCYVLLSFITLFSVFRNKEFLVLILLGCLSIFIRLFYKLNGDSAPVAGALQTEAAASMILISAGYYLIHKRFDVFVRPWMIPVSVGLAFVAASQRGGWLITPFFMAFAVNHLHQAPNIMLTFLSGKVLRFIGILSFSLYLWQQPMYKYFLKGKDYQMWESFLYLGIAFIVSTISFYAIEKRARDWLNKRW